MSQWEEVDPDDLGIGAPTSGDSTVWNQEPSQGSQGEHYDGFPPLATTPDGEDDDNPFGGVNAVDGLVYSEETVSPELQWQQRAVDVPLPPVRERPTPSMPVRAEPWKPGPDPVPAKAAGNNRAARLLVMMTFPLLIIAGLGFLVYKIMQAYGL